MYLELALNDPRAFIREEWRGLNILGQTLMEAQNILAKMPEYENEVDKISKQTICNWLNRMNESFI